MKIPSRKTYLLALILSIAVVVLIFGHPLASLAGTSQIGQNSASQPAPQTPLAFPIFKWPWPSSENGNIKWTSGPHSWSRGGNLTAKISAGRGNGLDFAKGGASFTVVSMASGTVITNTCGFTGLGCIVAIQHDMGGSVMVYAHLKPNAAVTAPLNDLQVGHWYSQATIIGAAGQSGGQSNIHLHIELRDGGTCDAPANTIDGANNGDDCDPNGHPSIGFAGSPVGWDGRQLVDNYYVNAYFDSLNYCGPGADCVTIFNYDGSAVKGSIAAPFINFPYNDNGIQRFVEAFVHPDFTCDSLVNCEINAADGTTVFGDHGTFSGGGGVLYSTNSAATPPPPPNDTTPPSGYFTSPAPGATINGSTVAIAVMAGDNAGGSGVREVRFSAKWGGIWRGIGVDTSSPYSINWDMCAAAVGNGDVELGMEVWDNANNKWVYSEHFSNPHITKNYSCPVDPPPPPQSNGVDLFTDPNYSGYHFVTPLTVDISNLGAATGGLFHDNIESAQVIGQYSYVLYENENYSGAHVYQTGSQNLNNQGWGNRADSIRVRNGNYSQSAYTLYSLGDFNGEAWSSDRTLYDLGHWERNDWAESMRVAAGYGIVACLDESFHGTCGRATGPAQFSDINALSQGLRHGVSSVRVCSGACPNGASSPVLAYPAEGETVATGSTIVLQWYGGGDQFRLELWGGGLGGTQTWGWNGDTQYSAGQLPASNNPYFWKVQANNGFGDSGWTQGSFYVMQPTVKALTAYVTAGTLVKEALPQVQWPGSSAQPDMPLTFQAGDQINLFLRAQNTFGTEATAYFSWHVTDPLGRVVNSMNWEGNLATPSGIVDWYLATTLPEFAISGDYQFEGAITYGGQTTSQSVTFSVVGPDMTEAVDAYVVAGTNIARLPAAATVDPLARIAPARSDRMTNNFNAGDLIELHLLVYNNASITLTTHMKWLVIDPQGRRVGALSWEGDLDVGDGLRNWYLGNSIPENAITGDYYFLGEATYGNHLTQVYDTFHVQGALPQTLDEIGGAILITQLPYNEWRDTWNTTTSPQDPIVSCTGVPNSNSVWYRYMPSATGRVAVDTAGSDFDTVVSVFSGSPDSLTEVACNDDSYGSGGSSHAEFQAVAGGSYYIAVMDWYTPGGGGLSLRVFSVYPMFLPYINRN